MHLTKSIRAAAMLEATKGLIVVVAGFGLLSFVHRDAQSIAEQLVAHLHLNPASRYPRVFIDASARLTDTRLWALATLAAAYATARFIEAYGLWRGRRWAEWFAAVSGGIYIPFEIFELAKRLDWLSVGTLLVNVFIVGLMIAALMRERSAVGSGTNAR